MMNAVMGHVDTVGETVSGWVTVTGEDAALTVCCVLDDILWISARAELPRPDVAQALGCGQHCGFRIALPPVIVDGREHAFSIGVLGHEDFHFPGSPASVVLGRTDIRIFQADMRAFQAACPEAAELQCGPGEPRAAFLAEACGRTIGYALCLPPDADEGAVGHRVLMDVHSPWRRRGAGSGLMEALLAWAGAQDGLTLTTSIALPDGGVVDFFKRRGFKEEAVRLHSITVGAEPVEVADLAWKAPQTG